MARRDGKARFRGLDLVLAALAALISGASGAWWLAHRTAQAAASAPKAAAISQTDAERFAEAVAKRFPEAYREFSRMTFERQANGELWPVEARFFAPAARFAADLADPASARSADIKTLEQTFAVSPPLSASALRERLEGLVGELAPPKAPRCQDYTIGRERDVPWPSWQDQRVREVVVEFNIGC